jgi:hypothetical protein
VDYIPSGDGSFFWVWADAPKKTYPFKRGGLGWGRCLNLYAKALIYIKAQDEADYRLLAFDTASPYVWEYRGAPKRFSFRVAYRGTRERDEGTLSPEETVSVGR